MVRAGAVVALCAVFALAPAAAHAAAQPGDGAAHVQNVRSGARGFGGRGFGGRGFGRSRPFSSRRYRSHGIFRRIIRALAIGYLLHLLFTTPGGLIVLVLIVVLIMLARRMRTRRYGY
jgi:hypothetical protein